MRHYIIILSLLTSSIWTFGQTGKSECNCPKNWALADESNIESRLHPDSTFYFSNGKKIIFCAGYKDTIYSEFILKVCGQDTAIDFWGDTWHEYRILFFKDTLTLEELTWLPVGRHFKYVKLIWTTEKIFFMKDELIRKKYLNKSISKYDKGQITTVLQECKTRKDKLEDRYYLAQKLFVATISGDKTARIYFNDFKKQIGMLDGIYAESYDYDLKEKLKEWDTE